jgi:hypothetical protein
MLPAAAFMFLPFILSLLISYLFLASQNGVSHILLPRPLHLSHEPPDLIASFQFGQIEGGYLPRSGRLNIG